VSTNIESDAYDATLGRREFLRRSNFTALDYAWLQTQALAVPSFPPSDAPIRRGYDFLYTDIAYQRIRIPSELLGEGMEPFDEYVEFTGAPLSKNVGNSDTIMERLEDAQWEQKIKTRLAGFGNMSARPVELRGTGALAGRYDIYVTLSPSIESPGTAIYFTEDGGQSGWVTSEISLSPLFELRPVDGGESLFVDTGVIPIPGFPMDLVSDGGRWQRHPISPADVSWDMAGQSLYYPDPLLILARDRGVDSGRTDAEMKADLREFITRKANGEEVDKDQLMDGFQAMCSKTQAHC